MQAYLGLTLKQSVYLFTFIALSQASADPDPRRCVPPLERLAGATNPIEPGPRVIRSIPTKHPMKATDYSRSQEWEVEAVKEPQTVEELAALVRTTRLPVSVKGGGYSMGGQTVAQHGMVIDMKNLNRVLHYDRAGKSITVEGGMTWKEIQEFIDPDNLSVKVMQSYNNFTVGGALGVNAHGRYMGFGPIISTVDSVKVLLADGRILKASRDTNPDLFAGVIGGYGHLGIIVEATLQLTDNVRLERVVTHFEAPNLPAALAHFHKNIAGDPKVRMANGDLQPGDDYLGMDVIAYRETDKPLTDPRRLQAPPHGMAKVRQAILSSLEQLFRAAKVYRAKRYTPEQLNQPRVVMQNFEASYDVNELRSLNDFMPSWLRRMLRIPNRKSLLQEYFIPKDQIETFLPKMKAVFEKHGVNITNVSLRDVPANSESTMSWADKDSFAVVVYYTQKYGNNPEKSFSYAQQWTQEILDHVLESDGSFYLPYQVLARQDQFERAYPRHKEFFEAKRKYDPNAKFSNNLWANYDRPEPFRHYETAMATPESRAELKKFFENVFNIYDADFFIAAIQRAMDNLHNKGLDTHDTNVYEELTKVLPKFAPGPLANVRKTVASLRNQQQEMADQTITALKKLGVESIDGIVEIGSVGRYIAPLRAKASQAGIKMTGPTHVIHDHKPSSINIADIMERTGGYRVYDPRYWTPIIRRDKFTDLRDYDPILQTDVKNGAVELATMYIGAHHAPPDKLRAFVESIHRILKPGGKFVIRDHHAEGDTNSLAHLAHDTYNAGLGVKPSTNQAEVRNIQPIEYWKHVLEDSGFKDLNVRVLQEGDPTGNTLMIFEKLPDGKQNLDTGTTRPLSAKSLPNDLDVVEATRALLRSRPNYVRPESNTIMTQPEWFLVDMFTEFARFSKESPWAEFPFGKFIQQYEDLYKAHRQFALDRGTLDQRGFLEYDEMDAQLLTGVKLLFGAMGSAAAVKRIRNGESPPPTSEPVVRVFDEFAEFMRQRPWYDFNFSEKIAQYREAGTPLPLATVALFRSMQLAANQIQKGLSDTDLPMTTGMLVKATPYQLEKLKGDSVTPVQFFRDNLVQIETPRYLPTTTAIRAMAMQGIEIKDIAGSDTVSVVVKSNRSPLPALARDQKLMTSYQYPTAGRAGGNNSHYITLLVPVSELRSLFQNADVARVEVVRVHDF